jgi:RNA polymerase-binding transcription factor
MAKATTKAATRSSSTAKKNPATKAKSAAKSRGSNGLDKFLEGQLVALQEERATYLRQAETLQAEADSLTEDREPGDVQFDEESGEGDTLAVERERDLALSAQARAAIEEIDRAVDKIHEGTYGRCENCGTAIPKERLKALPYAALCVKCKSGGLGLSR